MENSSEKVKLKRQRKLPYRKWSEQEQKLLVNFLRDNRPIEKPTAQLYYKRFLKQNHIDIEWSLVRYKVKYLKRCYIKAKSWRNSTGAGTRSSAERVKDEIEKMCPLFESLEEVFGFTEFESNNIIIDPEDSTTWDSFSDPLNSPSFDFPSTETKKIWPEIEEGDISGISGTAGAVPQNVESSSGQKSSSQFSLRNGINCRTAFTNELKMNSEFIEIKKTKMDMDFAIRMEELNLKKREIEMQEIENKTAEKLNILELEMKERIAMKKLEIKEKLEMEKIKRQFSES